MIEFLKQWDIQLFLAINRNYNGFFDFVMYQISNKYIWIPLYLFFLFLIFKNYRWKTISIFIFIILLTTLTDQLSVHLFKNVFERLRPCHNPDLQGLVHLVKAHCGGQFGFVSSHAANTFGLAIFLSLLMGKKYKYFTPLILLWAAIVGYSRIYLGVHYPADVIIGGLLGTVLAWLVFKGYKLLDNITG